MEGVSGENIVALCDVDETKLDAAALRAPNARKLRDFRKLYDHAKDFDAVVVSICEHAHAYATLPALQLGKHVYCEKPLHITSGRPASFARRQRKPRWPRRWVPDPRGRQLPPRGRTHPVERDRAGA